MTIRSVFPVLAGILLDGGAKKATKYIGERLVVKATVRSRERRGLHTQLLFTVGRPNYAERRFIKACRQSGERFPVKKIQVVWPKKSRCSRP